MNEFAERNRDYIVKAYTVEQKSTYQIAKELGVHAKRVLRALEFLKIPRRGYSDAQKNVLATGVARHPTKGKKYSADKKEKMSAIMAKYWQELPPEEKTRRAELSKKLWGEKTEEEIKEMSDAAAAACREAAKNGSKLERYLLEELGKHMEVQFHKRNLTGEEKLEVDLYIPSLKLALEIDGISHFEPIWGEERLQKHQQADTKKSSMLLAAGYNILRVKQTTKTLSLKKQRDTFDAIMKEISNFSISTNKLIEIEV